MKHILLVVAAMIVAVCASAGSAIAFDSPSPVIPAPRYDATNSVSYNTPGGTFHIDSFFDIFTDLAPPPPPAPNPNSFRIDSFFDVFVDLTIDNGGPPIHSSGLANPVVIQTSARPLNGTSTQFYDTEMTSLNLTLSNGVMLRESPTLASTGITTIAPNVDGTYRIGSFFDVFTEISLDNGATWAPANAPLHLTGVPEPSSMVLLSLGGIASLVFARRKFSA